MILHDPQVLLAIRGLGKSKSVLQQMPRDNRRPEKAVLHLMESHSAAAQGTSGCLDFGAGFCWVHSIYGNFSGQRVCDCKS